MIECKAGHKRGLKCSHKRNDGHGGVYCAIDATPEVCIFAGRKYEVIE